MPLPRHQHQIWGSGASWASIRLGQDLTCPCGLETHRELPCSLHPARWLAVKANAKSQSKKTKPKPKPEPEPKPKLKPNQNQNQKPKAKGQSRRASKPKPRAKPKERWAFIRWGQDLTSPLFLSRTLWGSSKIPNLRDRKKVEAWSLAALKEDVPLFRYCPLPRGNKQKSLSPDYCFKRDNRLFGAWAWKAGHGVLIRYARDFWKIRRVDR